MYADDDDDNNNNNNVTYFESFGVEYIPKETKQFIRNKNIITNINNAWIFFIGFIDFMLKGKILLDYTNLFSLNEYLKNEKIILQYFQ